jgi:CRP-like cAMP-binding protein
MSNIVTELVSSFMPITDELKQILEKVVVVKSFKKGEILLREGELADKYYMISKGCIRSYAVKDSEEKTLDFYTEGQIAVPINYNNETPVASIHYFDCIEDTIAAVSNTEYEKEILQQFPKLETLMPAASEMTSKMMSDYQSSILDFKTTSAEERYLKLRKERPDLIQRIPQYLLASYLGIKPESLSRIRRRMNKKD